MITDLEIVNFQSHKNTELSFVPGVNIKEGRPANYQDLSGLKFNRLLVLNRAPNRKGYRVYWNCLCDCGNKREVESSNLKSGHTQSCGCFQSEKRKEIRTSHGLCGTSEYNTWLGIKVRCYKKDDVSYKNYGGRGIKVCDRWRDSFQNFIDDMGIRPKNQDIDRKDNDGNYCPENCRWATKTTNARNKRNSKWWWVDGIRYESCYDAASKLQVTPVTVFAWCMGTSSRGKWRPPKEGCYSELKYKPSLHRRNK